MVRPEFFTRVADLSPVMPKVTEVRGRFFRMDFTSPVNHHFMFDLLNATGGKLNSSIYSQKRNGKYTVIINFPRSGNYGMWFYSSPRETGYHNGIGELGFNVEIPEVKWGEVPGGAQLLFPEVQGIDRNTQTEFRVKPGKWKYIALIRGSYWQYLEPGEDGVFTIDYKSAGTGPVYLAGCETESGAYETLAVFNVM
jgi:hypothetical protein